MLLHTLIERSAHRAPDNVSIIHKSDTLSYAELWQSLQQVRNGLLQSGLLRQERVAVYLDKRPETLQALFGASLAGGVFVPVNPLLKAEQVAYILQDCNVRILVTSPDRLAALRDSLDLCPDLHTVLLVGEHRAEVDHGHFRMLNWTDVLDAEPVPHHRTIDTDMAAILYTSGSTGRPKGVVLSHRNMVAGAESVAEYLQNRPEDRILSVLPLSFDYGLSQFTTAFSRGASVALLNYLLPRDVIKAVAKHGITGLAAVPPLWIQLAQLDWPEEARQTLRYVTNSGGAMPRKTLDALRERLPDTRFYLMYGLTEAFRSTYLPPEEVDRRPDSMGKAIPNAEILVVREDGSRCAPGEPGELVHRGALVSMGYWNDTERTAERFRPAPGQPAGIPIPEMAVWSGDTVRSDEDGFLYFIGRRDEMIKTSGYRVSPNEVEEVVYGTGLVAEVAALGPPHPVLGQGIVLVVLPREAGLTAQTLVDALRPNLPAYMMPAHVEIRAEPLPRNANGKIDRKHLATDFTDIFSTENEAT
ncbi:acyl-CoA ligase (AMP-forming), exosortase A system-associated [Thioalkalivibrio denitrificans]|uniref:Acyl-CoA ligase (AMP-forming), exosortase A system-associated n=1 Tax=Thioalkalivibrio denitrificans TaxID=108003 RepID=A0A1V3NIY8_9GAMM|nr:acyl-CoA ligase (AMP-forming), exosortase A system-associated [Thioalkalivibrio denitrificans]OOG24903.1 acyl-CoA ligase (AMP-forming), exosortase A system-associated [Thioalkalivibrio denitrificans]